MDRYRSEESPRTGTHGLVDQYRWTLGQHHFENAYSNWHQLVNFWNLNQFSFFEPILAHFLSSLLFCPEGYSAVVLPTSFSTRPMIFLPGSREVLHNGEMLPIGNGWNILQRRINKPQRRFPDRCYMMLRPYTSRRWGFLFDSERNVWGKASTSLSSPILQGPRKSWQTLQRDSSAEALSSWPCRMAIPRCQIAYRCRHAGEIGCFNMFQLDISLALQVVLYFGVDVVRMYHLQNVL